MYEHMNVHSYEHHQEHREKCWAGDSPGGWGYLYVRKTACFRGSGHTSSLSQFISKSPILYLYSLPHSLFSHLLISHLYKNIKHKIILSIKNFHSLSTLPQSFNYPKNYPQNKSTFSLSHHFNLFNIPTKMPIKTP